MNNNEFKGEKKHIAKCQDGKQRTLQYKAFKSKIEGLEDAVFESKDVKHADQLIKKLEDIAISKSSTTATWQG